MLFLLDGGTGIWAEEKRAIEKVAATELLISLEIEVLNKIE